MYKRVQDSQSRCAVPRGVSSEADTDAAKRGVADEPSIDDEAERLRAALLEQVGVHSAAIFQQCGRIRERSFNICDICGGQSLQCLRYAVVFIAVFTTMLSRKSFDTH